MSNEEYSEYFEPQSTPEELLSGTALKWYQSAIDYKFSCTACGETFPVEEQMVTLSYSGNAPSVFDRLRSHVGGGNAYDVSDETVEKGLFTNDGTLVQGVITCPFCLRQHGHHHDVVVDQLGIPKRD